MKIIKINSANKVDRKTFDFYFPKDVESLNPIVPCVKIDDTLYVIANFGFQTNELVLFEEVCDYAAAINLAVKLRGGNLNIIELSNIYMFILNNNLNVENFSFFKEYNIVSKKQFHILERLQYLPDNLKSYIVEKDIAFKYLNILTNFDEKIIEIISNYVHIKNPSVSNFRILINNIYDFKDEINFENDLDSEILRLRNEFNKRRFDFEKKITELLQIGNGIVMENKNNFELCTISVNFEVKSFEDFLDKIKTLEKSERKVEEVFNILKNNDLC
ncbi:hypothetical protein LF845_04515 [Deferribacterales bacterium Es71-Z0220]|uniref:hypothetical protein n=1 Tax=Deferrivibrio essentukiensis TaxID=2880922 RepID=UPI001F624C8A|nr:hypothetical protein [Deferrivibrio essentukiensis]MCB4204222.1 hypothetical protein [Deferrivibrio essentukiensis]